MSSTMIIPSKGIQYQANPTTKSPMTSKENRLYQSPTITIKASIKDNTTSSLQSSEANIGAESHIPKTLHR
jgi:hypothetical protein